MGSPRRPAFRRAGWLLVVAGLVSAALSFLAPRAEADGAIATWLGPGAGDTVVGNWKGREVSYRASTMELEIGGATYVAYCIDLATATPAPGATYEEVPWNEANVGSDLPRINWVLHRGYPNATLADLRAVAGPDLTKAQAAAATQAAVWHYSDGFDLDEAKNPAPVVALYRHLTDDAVNVGITEQPPVSISLSPATATGEAGTRIGPFVVATTGGDLALSTDAGLGGVVVDGSGTAVTSAGNGDEVWVQVPAGTPAGGLTLTATGTATVQTGRVFVVPGQAAQKFVLASAATAPVQDTAAVTWTSTPPGVPSASARPSCAEGAVVVTLRNDGGRVVTMRVRAEGFDKPAELAPGASAEILVPVAAGAAYDITVSDGSSFFQQFTGTLDCDGFGAVATPSCADGGVQVRLQTPAGTPATFEVTGPEGFRQTVEVAVGETRDVLVPVAGGAYEIVVRAGAYTRTLTGSLDCGSLTATATPRCLKGGLGVVLTNGMAAERAVTVTPAGGAPVSVTVPAGETREVVLPMTQDAAYEVTVTTDGVAPIVLTGSLTCDDVVASVIVEPRCAAGGLLVTLRNPGAEVVTYTVGDRQVVVAPGAEGSVTVPVAADQPYDLTVTAGSFSRRYTGTLGCGELTATAVADCAAGGQQVTLSNTGAVPATFRVDDGRSARTVEVAPAGTQRVLVPVENGATFSIAVGAGSFVKVMSGTQQCTVPAPQCTATSEVRPDLGGVLVTLKNTGTIPARFLVVAAPGVSEAVDVAGGASQDVLVRLSPGSAYNIAVTCGSFSDNFSGRLPDVLGGGASPGGTLPQPVTPLTSQLPRTGAGTGGLLLLAGIFIGLGAVLLVVQDVARPRTRPAPR